MCETAMDYEEAPKEISIDTTKSLTIKIANAGDEKPASSPSFSPPSSAFVSALQSPYISPRAISETPTPATTLTHSSPPVSYSGSQSDDLPCTSYIPAVDPPPPRISFSFPAPRSSFAKSSASPASTGKLRSCDVYIGYHGQNPDLVRFCKWLKSELEIQGIACFVADRAKYSDGQSHEIADRVICSVAFGVVVVGNHTLNSRLSLEEILFFAQKKNLIPLFFDTEANDIATLYSDNREAVDGLLRFHEFKLEANDGNWRNCNWRNCISRTAGILMNKLGRKSVTDKEPDQAHDEITFPRNKHFVGRERDIIDIETAFFGSGDYPDQENIIQTSFSHSDGLADGESEAYISLDIGRYKEPSLEAWVEKPAAEPSRNSTKKTKCKKSKIRNYTSVICLNGTSGVGKTELALEFAHRYSQRYKMVLWVGGEARYFRQNILNISRKLGLDISADEEKERGKIRSFEEQESEAFKRVKRELFRDTPYLLIIDNLESEREWWEGKDLHDLLPRNTGGTHVIITTRLSRVMTLDPIHLQPLSHSEAMLLVRGRRKRDYPPSEVEIIRKFDEKLERSSFGLWVVGSLLTELSIMPSALFEAINEARNDEMNLEAVNLTNVMNPFLIKVMSFCGLVLEQSNLLALRMLQVGAWLAPAPVSIYLLVAAAKSIPFSISKLKKWVKCCFSRKSWKNEEESAMFLVRLGLARRVSNKKHSCWIQFHPITQAFARWKYGLAPAKAAVQGVQRVGSPSTSLDHLWGSAFLVFGFKSEAPVVNLKAVEMVLFVKKTAIPLAVEVYSGFSRCGSGLEVLKVCTEVLEEVEKTFVCRVQDWCNGSMCWKGRRVDEYLWQEVTLMKAAVMEMRARLLVRGGEFDGGEEVCRSCISIRTVMLGHGHGLTLAAQETLARLVRMRSKSM